MLTAICAPSPGGGTGDLSVCRSLLVGIDRCGGVCVLCDHVLVGTCRGFLLESFVSVTIKAGLVFAVFQFR
jgi:hypothetical protein